MRRFWKRHEEAELQSRLERRREPARGEFVNQLGREVRETGRRRFVPSRLLLAAALTLLMLVAVASVGGVSAGAGVRQQLAAVVQSVNKQVTAQGSLSVQSDDDDDGGGSGGRGDDDDDDGDDGDDDQYEEDEQECLPALEQAHDLFHEGQFTAGGHRIYHAQLRQAREECDDIGGDDDDD